MGLADQQRLLARLATDPALRERFGADPAAVGAQCGCSPDDIRALTHTAPGQLFLFARSLQSKRLGEVRKLLPLTCRTLGPRAAPLFRRYADANLPTGLHRHQQDALAFAAWLPPMLAADLPALPTWLADLIRYESGWLRTADPTCRWHAVCLRYAILSLFLPVADDNPPAVLRRPALACWWRVPGLGPLHHRVFPLSPRAKSGEIPPGAFPEALSGETDDR